MSRSLHLASAAMAVAAAVLAAAPARADTLTIDNFDEYTNGQIIGSNYGSTPYILGGNHPDVLYAVKSPATRVLDGTTSGFVNTAFQSGATGYTVVGFDNFAAGGVTNNLTGYDSFSILTKSLLTSGTSTAQLQLFISDTSTSGTGASYISNATVTESTTAETATFSLTGPFTITGFNDTRADADSVATVLSKLGAIGVQITDPTASAATPSPNESFAFDDLEATSSAPEPASALLLGVAAAPVALGRRRRRMA